MSGINRTLNGIFLALLATAIVSPASGQSADSLRTQVLEMIVFEVVQPEGDTLQNFYRANAAATTETILSRMQGVHLIQRGAYGQEPVFRGLQGGQINVTIDGMKIFGACTDKMDPVTIYVEPQNLATIEMISGTHGSAFGSTFGGALNMNLAEPVTGGQKVSGRAGAGYQTAARASGFFSNANISREKTAYRISATHRKSDDYRAGGGTTVPFSQYEKVNIAAAGKWTIGNYDTLLANVLYDEGWNIGFPALPMDVGNATAGIFALTWRHVAPISIFRNFSLKAYHNRIHHIMDDTDRKEVIMHMDMPGKSKTTGVLAEADVHLFHDHQTLVTVDYFTNDLIGEMTMYPEEGSSMYMQTAPDATRQNAGFFISQKVRLNDKSKLLMSVRGDLSADELRPGTGRDQWKVFYRNLSPTTVKLVKTFSLLYSRKLANHIRLEVQSGYGERNTTLNERYGYYLFNRFDGYDYLGNPLLKNESSWNSEATLQYFGNHIEWQIAPFHQAIKHYVLGETLSDLSPMTLGANGVKQYQNVVSATLMGLDAMMLARPLPTVQAIASIKYTYGKTANGMPLSLIPPLKTVASLRYEKKAFHLQAEWEWAAAQTRINTAAGERSTPAFSLLSMRTGWKINSFLQCNAGIENIFDKNYREHLDWGGIPRPGRNGYLNIIYKFSIDE